MKIWRILYETGDTVYVAKDTIEEAIAYMREQGNFPHVMEISEVKEREETE